MPNFAFRSSTKPLKYKSRTFERETMELRPTKRGEEHDTEVHGFKSHKEFRQHIAPQSHEEREKNDVQWNQSDPDKRGVNHIRKAAKKEVEDWYKGKDHIGPEGPSFFNPSEAFIVKSKPGKFTEG